MTMASPKAQALFDPLKDMFGDILSRLEALESKVGISGSSSSSPSAKPSPSTASLTGSCVRSFVPGLTTMLLLFRLTGVVAWMFI